MKIIIDAGHGPDTPGKRSPDETLREFQFNNEVANNVKHMLSQYKDVEILFSHAQTKDVSLSDRCTFANNNKADLFVSIHANAYGTDWNNAQGIETYTYISKPDKALELAAYVQTALIRATGRPNRGIKQADFAVLRETNMTAILVECGFMTNKEECNLLKSADYRALVATGIVKGIVDCYGLKKSTPITGSSGLFKVQVGAFANRTNAENMVSDLKRMGYKDVIIVQ